MGRKHSLPPQTHCWKREEPFNGLFRQLQVFIDILKVICDVDSETEAVNSVYLSTLKPLGPACTLNRSLGYAWVIWKILLH